MMHRPLSYAHAENRNPPPHIGAVLDCLAVVFPDLVIANSGYGRQWAVARFNMSPAIYITRIIPVRWDLDGRCIEARFIDLPALRGHESFVAHATRELQRARPLHWDLEQRITAMTEP